MWKVCRAVAVAGMPNIAGASITVIDLATARAGLKMKAVMVRVGVRIRAFIARVGSISFKPTSNPLWQCVPLPYMQ